MRGQACRNGEEAIAAEALMNNVGQASWRSITHPFRTADYIRSYRAPVNELEAIHLSFSMSVHP
ncbi:MAG: hypothetical protein OJF51_001951 [Nitrospira sp.]|nr:MAG: hypothetical protein OJF51_001951 [Nitrospira sp.]